MAGAFGAVPEVDKGDSRAMLVFEARGRTIRKTGDGLEDIHSSEKEGRERDCVGNHVWCCVRLGFSGMEVIALSVIGLSSLLFEGF